MERKLVAAIACRNQGTRLYGTPLQNLDVDKGIKILDNIILCLKSIKVIDEIVLGISTGIDNESYKKYNILVIHIKIILSANSLIC